MSAAVLKTEKKKQKKQRRRRKRNRNSSLRLWPRNVPTTVKKIKKKKVPRGRENP